MTSTLSLRTPGESPRASGAVRNLQRGIVALLLPAAAATAQPTDWPPQNTLLNGDPPVAGVAFGEWLAASDDYLLVTGLDSNGVGDYRGWTQDPAQNWTPLFTQSLSSPDSEVAPVALVGSLAYRHTDNPVFGFRLSRLDLADLDNNMGAWDDVWAPAPNANARMRSIDASPSIFLNSRLLVVGWQNGSSSAVEVLRDQDAGPLSWYGFGRVGGGAPSVSADVDQVAVGLPGRGEVITVVDGTPWTQESVLLGPASAGAFGTAVALRDNLLAVSAPETTVCVLPPDIGCAAESGQVWIYQRFGDVWTFATPLFTTADVVGGEGIGSSLRFSDDGTRLAVGATGVSTTYLFAKNGSGNWDLLARTASSPPQNDGAGAAVAFAGNGDLFVGAPTHDVGAGPVGAALLFREAIFSDGFDLGNTDAWSQRVP